MKRIWRYLFTGATYAVLLGLIFLAYAVFKPTQPFVFIGIVALGLLFFWLYYRHFGPKLGTED
jgi:hypothetical protein